MLWVLLVLLYGVFKGLREGAKKKAMETSPMMEVLFFYTAVSFLLSAPFCGNVFAMPPVYYLWIFLKSVIIFIAWICGFRSVSRMPVSLYGVMDLTRVVFTTGLSVLILHESMGIWQIIGLGLVLIGLGFSGGFGKKKDSGVGAERPDPKILLLVLICCLCNSVTGIMDKLLMRTGELTTGQYQFWYMLFLTLLYLGYLIVTRTKVSVKTVVSNKWILLMAFLFVVGDRALFIANSDPNSRVTIMTLIQQSAVLVTIVTGRILFKEKHILRRILAALVIIAGILLSLL